MGFSYGTVSGFRLSPTLNFSYRNKLSSDLAIELSPFFTPDFAFKSDQNFRWSTGIAAGPLFQFNDKLALSPRLALGATRGRVAALSDAVSDVNLLDQTTFTMDLGISAIWSIGRQWDFRPRYTYSGIGAKNGFQAHIGVLEFVHFW